MPKPEQGRSTRLLKTSGFLAYLFVITIGFLEIGLRLLLPQPLTYDAPELYMPDETIGWRRKPNARGTAKWQGPVVPICTDSEGDRVSCLPKSPRRCTNRILVIGDSMVEALAVPYEETVWNRIEEDTGACVDVTGVGGYDPSQYLQVARERLRSSESYRLVIVNLFAGNDFRKGASKIPPPREVARARFHWLPKSLSIVGFRNWLYPVNQYLESRSHVYVAFRNVFRRKYLAENSELVVIPSQLTESIIEETLRPIRALADESKAAGAEAMIVLIPSHRQVLDPTGEMLLEALPTLEGDLDMDLPTKRIVPQLRQIPGVRFIDLLPWLRARATAEHWGELDPHFSPKGHALWFELLRDQVRAALEIPASAPL